jgi:hypothetical protein
MSAYGASKSNDGRATLRTSIGPNSFHCQSAPARVPARVVPERRRRAAANGKGGLRRRDSGGMVVFARWRRSENASRRVGIINEHRQLDVMPDQRLKRTQEQTP